METLLHVCIHNHAHEGYFRAQRRLSKGEQVVDVTTAEFAQLEADPRITVISVSDVQPDASDQSDGAQGDVVSDLVPGGITEPLIMPSYYVPVINKQTDAQVVKAKSSRKKS